MLSLIFTQGTPKYITNFYVSLIFHRDVLPESSSIYTLSALTYQGIERIINGNAPDKEIAFKALHKATNGGVPFKTRLTLFPCNIR